MPDYKFLDPIHCVVTRLSTSIKIPLITKKETEVCEVVLKDTGAKGVLVNYSLALFVGAEVIAEFHSVLPRGRYLLQLGPNELSIARTSGGAKILNFPVRNNET
jgi:hypothetical protein